MRFLSAQIIAGLAFIGKIAVLVLPVMVWLHMDEIGDKDRADQREFSSLAALGVNGRDVISGRPLSHDERVNMLLQETDDKRKWASAKVEVDNYHYAPDVQYGLAQRKLLRLEEMLHYGIKEQEVGALAAQAGLEEDLQINQVLDEQINTKLVNVQVEERRVEKANEEYVRKFLENARRAGYQVTLDKDLRIRSVRWVGERPTY